MYGFQVGPHADSEDLAKGGIMIVCPKLLQPIKIGSERPPQLEVVSILVTITHSNSRMCILAIYRCPRQPLATFLSFVDQFISNLPQLVPTIILGDFNNDLLKHQAHPDCCN